MSARDPIAALLRTIGVAIAGGLIGFFLALFFCIMGMALFAAIQRRDLDFTVSYRLVGPIAAGAFFFVSGLYWMVREFRSSR
jgi:hypothetical protein